MARKPEQLTGDALVQRVKKLKASVRFFYDLQKLRIQTGNRNSKQAEPAALDEDDKAFLGRISDGTKDLEREALKETKRLLRGIPIWESFLKDVRGIGPTMGGIIISEIDIHAAETVSALWAHAGLAVDNRTLRAKRLKRGERANFNPFLKSKLVLVTAESFIKANSPYRKYYDNYKARKKAQHVAVCMNCNGKGTWKPKKEDDKDTKKQVCTNCNGTGGPAPWGASDAHRHSAAMRYMIKMFLKDLWEAWRTLEGLSTPGDYAETKLGIKHGEHAPSTSITTDHVRQLVRENKINLADEDAMMQVLNLLNQSGSVPDITVIQRAFMVMRP
jgi:hypothetical protein